MEYYFDEQLRWALGFENPNKAAAVIASLLPVVWIGWALAWRIRLNVLRWAVVLSAGALLCGGWWVLLQTLSRGGILAALAAFAYISWAGWNRAFPRKERVLLAAIVVMATGVLFISTQAARRGLESATDRSVGNRLTLWMGALQMIAESPQGVGAGNSGDAYMQWYQPIESTSRYRTLVNSYLTFAVERGLWLAGLSAAAALWFWRTTACGETRGARAEALFGLRASLVAFAIAGFFSTTMEDWRVWVIPVAVAVCQAGLSPMRRRVSQLRPVCTAGVAAVAGCATLYSAGWIISESATPVRVYGTGWSIEQLDVTMRPPNAGSGVAVLVDHQVFGRDYGKLLRRLAMRTGATVHAVSGGADVRDTDVLIATGATVSGVGRREAHTLFLIAPATIDEPAARELLGRFELVQLMLPAFDEDGRVASWEQLWAGGESADRSSSTRLSGVGNDVGWAWDEVMDSIAASLQGDKPTAALAGGFAIAPSSSLFATGRD